MGNPVTRRKFLKQTAVTGAAIALTQKAGLSLIIKDEVVQLDSAIEERINTLLARMTLEEKIQMVHGENRRGYIGYIPAIPRLGIPELALTDGPAGVRHGPGTAFPAPVALAATWDLELAHAYGAALGAETKAKGQNVLLGPMVNIVRVPEGGRNFETLGEDPYLAAQIAVAEIRGIQSQGVLAEVKHYAGNNQEKNRVTVSAQVDERTLREIYLPAFEASVKEAKVGSVMAAYNKVNGTFCSENAHLLKDILKDDWKFDGFVVSDWGATHSTVEAANNGLDIEMPTGEFFGEKLLAAVKSGQVTQARIDDKVRRILRVMMRFGFFDRPTMIGPIDYKVQAQVARRVAAAGVVLLKNENDVLPLDVNRFKSIAVIGPYADRATTGGGGSARISPLYGVSPLTAILERVGNKAIVRFLRFVAGNDLSRSDPPTTGAGLLTDAVQLAKECDIVLVFARDFETEGADRTDIALPEEQDAMIKAIVGANRHTIVVLNTGSIVLVEKWADQVPAILQAWYPGQDDGNVIADVLFGLVNPSGKLPITFPRARQDVAVSTPEQYPGANGIGLYSEGIFVGYRHFDKNNIAPQFPFGHGLSYTRFEYSNLRLINSRSDAAVVNAEFVVQNTGARAGAEVAQLYVQHLQPRVARPVKELKGFRKIFLKPRERQMISIPLDHRGFAFYDTEQAGWTAEKGECRILVGSSSRDIRLRADYRLELTNTQR